MRSFRNWKPGPPSPAMVVALVALTVSLGGSAWAVTTIGTKQIRNGAVTEAKLKRGAVTTSKLRAGAVTSTKLRDGAVTAEQLGDGSVTGQKVSAGAIGESALLEDAVTGDKIARTTVRAENMKNGSVPLRAIQQAARLPLRGALAWGVVDRVEPPVLIASATSGFTAVTRPAVGTYCLTPSPEVAALAFGSDGNPVRPLLASVEWARSTISGALLVAPNGTSHGSCPSGQYEVFTYKSDGTPWNAVSFIVAIP